MLPYFFDRMMKNWKTILEYALIVLAVILIRTFVVTRVQVDGNSMADTLHDKDIMFLNIIKYKFANIQRFDIVVFDYQGEPLIKRVIGLPGDKVSYYSGVLKVNGKVIKESYIDTNGYYGEDYAEEKVPSGKYFVMGDNRDNSLDSRMIGFIDREKIMGNADFIMYPFDRFGFVKE